MGVEKVNSRKGLIRRMQELAAEHDVEVKGSFIHLPRQFPFVLPNSAYRLTYGTEDSGVISRNISAPCGYWHSNSPSLEDIFLKWAQNRDHYERPTQKDLLKLVCGELSELVVVAPLITIEICSPFGNHSYQPIAQYMRRVREVSRSVVTSNAFSNPGFLERISVNPFSYIDEVALALSIDQLIWDCWEELSLPGNRFQDAWAEFSAVLGLKVKVAANRIINPKYALARQELEGMLPAMAAEYAPRPLAGRALYEMLADTGAIITGVKEVFQRIREEK
ncbi:hypothetical protein HYY72_04965 [Candidatus Woesearchaeota archaeon]|nr:hypothetical protein [Candidatus Woesearchaeota archaeon]